VVNRTPVAVASTVSVNLNNIRPLDNGLFLISYASGAGNPLYVIGWAGTIQFNAVTQTGLGLWYPLFLTDIIHRPSYDNQSGYDRYQRQVYRPAGPKILITHPIAWWPGCQGTNNNLRRMKDLWSKILIPDTATQCSFCCAPVQWVMRSDAENPRISRKSCHGTVIHFAKNSFFFKKKETTHEKKHTMHCRSFKGKGNDSIPADVRLLWHLLSFSGITPK